MIGRTYFGGDQVTQLNLVLYNSIKWPYQPKHSPSYHPVMKHQLIVGATPPVPDCTRCTYTMGQSWLPDPLNCHRYYICEKINVVASYYRLHHPTCGSLYWDQGSLTCVSQKPDDCSVDDVVTVTPPGGTDGKHIRVVHRDP